MINYIFPKYGTDFALWFYNTSVMEAAGMIKIQKNRGDGYGFYTK